MARTLQSPSAADRLGAARAFVAGFPAATEILLIGATREAVDDLARELAAARGATFGLHRFSLTQLAATLAAPEMAARGLAPASPLGAEALAARATAALSHTGRLRYFAPVQAFPGFARALAATLTELRLAALTAGELAPLGDPGPDLAALLDEYDAQLASAAIADRAELLRIATSAARAANRFAGMPLLLLDVAVDPGREASFVEALIAAAGEALVTAPGPRSTSTPSAARSLNRLQEHLFAAESPATQPADESVVFFSAPGEARECVEIARYILDEASKGVAFDQVAVFLRTPQVYTPLLETAFRRAGIAAYFARGSSRPDATGRAFLALLACREEGLTATRFAEYVSLAQVPAPAPADDAAEDAPPFNPTKWEELLIDAAVIGGRDRWARRLEGHAAELRGRLDEVRREDPDSARGAGLERSLANLDHLRAFALPVVESLAALPAAATWGEWLPALRSLANRTLRVPARVLAILDELQPMEAVGPVSVAEIARVLAERLSTLEEEPPEHRHGRVFVAPAVQARGRLFDVVFVPGLAERIFPQRPREDPLLLDALRRQLSPSLRTQTKRDLDERLLLELTVGAASSRVYLSFPRVDVGEARPRVPSFYGLDVVRATRGQIPPFEELEREAFDAAGARLAWPAPPKAERAIDAVEHDLAVLGPLLHGADLSAAKGRGKYLLELNPWLRESLRTRYARWQRKTWSARDGLIRPGPAVLAALTAQGLRARPYSATALQRFAACPYQFLLAAIYRFEPREEPQPLEQLDPLTRGRFFHEVQAATLRALRADGEMPLAQIGLVEAGRQLEIARLAAAEKYREELAPPIDRVWQDEMKALRADLHTWLRRLVEGDDIWQPRHFELAFGLPLDDQHDAASQAEPVELPGGWKLRGAVDLVEEARDGSALRVTDHKTGKDPGKPLFAVGGGEVLQPVLYALAVEAAVGKRVRESRLYYCTTRGGFREYPVPLTDGARQHGQTVLETIDQAIESGSFPPAPREKACDWCDFRPVCGPYEERRVRECKQPLPELQRLRELP